MAECCPDCKTNEGPLKQHRDKVLAGIESALKALLNRPGTANCDVNVYFLDEQQRQAVRHLEQAHEATMKMFNALGAS